MELFHSTQDEPIAVVDGANNISFSLIPDESFDDTNISCVATTMDSSKYYENSITVFVAGNSSILMTLYYFFASINDDSHLEVVTHCVTMT